MYPRHQELFKTLIEFYTLQVQLGNLPSTALRVPDNANAVFNRDAALEAGFTEEAVKVMSSMPYLDSDEAEEFELLPSTYPERYVQPDDDDMISYRGRRELDTNPSEGVYLPPSFIKITSQDIYGHVFLYDTDTELVREWRPFYDGINIDNQNFDLLVANPPAKAFQPWIDSYRQLKVFRISPIEVSWQPDTSFPQRPAVVVEAEETLRLAQLKIRDLYLQHGWNVNSKNQDHFDVETYLQERDAYREQVLAPLSEKVSEAWKTVQEQERQEREL